MTRKSISRILALVCALVSLTGCVLPLANAEKIEEGLLGEEPWYRNDKRGSIKTPYEAVNYFRDLVQTSAFRELAEAFINNSSIESDYYLESVHRNFLYNEKGRITKDSQLGAAYDHYCKECGMPLFSHVKASSMFSDSWKIQFTFSEISEGDTFRYLLIYGSKLHNVITEVDLGFTNPKTIFLSNNWCVISDDFPDDLNIDYLFEDIKTDALNKDECSVSTLVSEKKLQIRSEEDLSFWYAHRFDSLNNELISSIERIEISGIQKIPIGAFCHLTSVKTVILSDAITDIEESAFFRCSSLNEIQWSCNLKSIGDFSFLGCGFEDLIIPNGVITIGQDAFSYMHMVKSIILPDSVRELKGDFANCSQLQTILLPTKLCAIPDGMLFAASGLKELTIPASVQSVGIHFMSNSGVQRLIIEGMPYFQQLFDMEDYPSLKQVVYLGDPPPIDRFAFQQFSGICIYYLNSNAESWEKQKLLWDDITIIGIDSIEELPLIEHRGTVRDH